VREAVVPIYEENTELHSEQCAGLLARLSREYAEGLAEFAWLGGAAEAFVPPLSWRFSASSDHRQRVSVIRAYGATGWQSQAGVQQLVDILEDNELAPFHTEVLKAIAEKGPSAKRAKASVLRWLRTAEYDPAEALIALDRIGEKVERPILERLLRGYAKRCEFAGSVFMFNLDRDERCRRQAKALERSAARSGVVFEYWMDAHGR